MNEPDHLESLVRRVSAALAHRSDSIPERLDDLAREVRRWSREAGVARPDLAPVLSGLVVDLEDLAVSARIAAERTP